jgi:hypothetical protein
MNLLRVPDQGLDGDLPQPEFLAWRPAPRRGRMD